MSIPYKLYNKDFAEVVPMLSGKEIVITDPPYGIDYDPQRYKRWNGDSSKFAKIQGDDVGFDPSVLFYFEKLILWGGNNFSDKLPRGGWLCWDKRTSESADKMIGSPFELAWNNQNIFKILRLQHGGVINADSVYGNNAERVHPTQKPIALMKWCIKLFSNPDDVIFDPFMGSGTTGIAAWQLGRRFIGCEIDPKYFAIAEKRIKQAAQQPALMHEAQQSVQRTGGESGQQSLFSAGDVLPAKVTRQSPRR